MMLNNRRMISVATTFAGRVRRDLTSLDSRPEAFVRHAYRIMTSTDPDNAIVQDLAPLVATGKDGEIDACHILLNSNAFLYVD